MDYQQLPDLPEPHVKDEAKHKEEVKKAFGLMKAVDDPRYAGKLGETKLVKALKDFELLMNDKVGATEVIERI